MPYSAARLVLRSLLLLVAIRTVAAQEFVPVGPGGGGAMFHPVIHPRHPDEVLVACDMTGSYQTHDGGATWRMFSLRGVAHFFAFDPVRPRVVYAGTNALWRSTDDGRHWSVVWPATAIQSVRMSSDHADEELVTDGQPAAVPTAMAIDPAEAQTLYLATSRGSESLILVSRDDGRHWQTLRALPERALHLWADPRGTTVNRRLIVATDHGLLRREHGAWQSDPLPSGASASEISLGFTGPGNDGIAYATTAAGVLVKHLHAQGWTASALPGTGAQVRAVATSLHHPQVAYVAFRNLRLPGKLPWEHSSTASGVARTQDAGRSWQLVWQDTGTAAANVHDAWINAELGTDWAEEPITMTVGDEDTGLVYATDLGRTLKTTDSGATWHALYARRAGTEGWTTTGLNVTTAYDYIFDPLDHQRRWLPMTDIGLFRSEDGGASWIRSMHGVPQRWSNTAYAVVLDPSVRGKLWGAFSGTHDLPRPKMWRHTRTALFRGGICVSQDGGRSWKPVTTGIGEIAPTSILVDPTTPPGHRTLWITTMGRGIFRSTDDGVSWKPANNGIAGAAPLTWRLVRAVNGTLFALVARRSEDGSIGNEGDGALYRSTDGGEHWVALPLPPGVNGPSGLALDTTNPQRMYLAAWCRDTTEHGAGGGVYLTVDGGNTWRSVLSADQHVYDVTVDPRKPETLYAVGFESSAWRSQDHGEHWSRIPGFDFKWMHRVVPDQDDPAKIYIATFGGGVWHGPAAGVPGAPAIITPALRLER
ncbi:MAG: exo-alpha-sialidase [Acidobacteriota bacterium]|nr:exo-alpha-sialidase [Acidobacteriota bacterium]